MQSEHRGDVQHADSHFSLKCHVSTNSFRHNDIILEKNQTNCDKNLFQN